MNCFYVVSAMGRIVGAFDTMEQVDGICKKHNIMQFISQKYYFDEKHPKDSVWFSLLKDKDICAIASNDRSKVEKMYIKMADHGLSYHDPDFLDNIDAWKLKVNEIHPMMRKELEKCHKVSKLFGNSEDLDRVITEMIESYDNENLTEVDLGDISICD